MSAINSRIKWRDFIGTFAYRAMQATLRICGYRLVVEFNANNEAFDVYILNVRGAHAARVLVSAASRNIMPAL